MLEFEVVLDDPTFSKSEMSDTCVRLKNDILKLNVKSAYLKTESVSTVHKSGEVFTIGALIIATLPAVLPPIIGLLQAWMLRGENRTVTIKSQIGDNALEVTIPSDMDEQKLDNLIQKITSMNRDQDDSS